uniref:Tolloid-like protein 2 n=2 Tax=Bactrocera dorsalis TaxID=27457 RepID=A0A034V5E0_BACDO
MASAHILQYYSNTRTKTAAAVSTKTATATTIAQHCYERNTSGTPEACLITNERKQFADESSATAVSKSTTTTTAKKTSRAISTALLSYCLPPIATVDNIWVHSNAVTTPLEEPTDDQKLHSTKVQVLHAGIANEVNKEVSNCFETPTPWKSTAATKRPSFRPTDPMLSPNQKSHQAADDVHTFRCVDSGRRGRSKSESAESYGDLQAERPQRPQQQQQKQQSRWHSESRSEALSCGWTRVKGIANMSSAAASNANQQQQGQCSDVAGIVVGAIASLRKTSTGNCARQRSQAIAYMHCAQTKEKHNNTNNKTKCCQSNETKQSETHNVARGCHAAGECDCCCNPHLFSSCTRQSSRNAIEQQQQLQLSGLSNGSNQEFSQLLADSCWSLACNAAPQLLKQPQTAAIATPLQSQSTTTTAKATNEQRSIFQYKTNKNSNLYYKRGVANELYLERAAAADADFGGGCGTILSTLCCSVRSKLLLAVADLQALSRALLSLIIIFNMLPLFYAECDQTFVSRIGGPQNGTFTAPLLHNHKNHSRQCLYTFLAGPGQRVEVLFTSFNLRGSPPDGSAVGELPACVHEYMDIYSEVQSSDPAELINSPFGGRYCGTIPPRRRISMYRAIAISFFTNKNVSTPDLFEGTYRFINASEYEIGIPIAGSPCSYTITPSMSINKTGALISPTYPGAYPKDMSCTYQFLGESNQRVRLEFRDFDLFFGGPHCPFDYVKVYDGPDNSSALIGTYCGQQRNLVLYSSESSLFVHFYTLPRTANTQNRGFKGIYEFSESFVKLDFIRENDGIHMRGSECDQKILSRKESTGFVLSPNYPYPYIQKTVCRYFIYGMQDAQHLERVRLEFSSFNIPKVEHKDKSESNCTDGYLKIYLKGQETADAYDKFDYELCGNETQRVLSDGPRLAMVFSSGELQGRGFKGKYTFETEYKIPGTAAPDGTCSFTYVSSSKKRGELNSPRYPSNYPSDTNCSYLFLGEPNEQVTIVFDHFKIKADGHSNATAGAYGSSACFEDWLEMYVVYRDNNDRFLGRYCGLTAPGPVESPRGAVGLRITLHTDQENVASGFKARYFFESPRSDVAECGGNFSGQDSGIITSPNYPAGYKAPSRGMASMACNWIMTARPGYKLSINFEHFSIEGDPANRGCPAAVLRLWVNVDSDQPPLELCGEKPLIEQWYYISTGQTARISFTTSDKTVGAPGFRIVWTEIQDSGPGPPSIGLLCESTYHFQCDVGYCISDKLRCDGVKNCGPGDDSDELHCTTQAPEEDHGVLIIITLIVVSFLICLLCTLCHSKRKRRAHVRQLGLHRNAHYDSQTSATGLSSSRRHLQGGASISGSLHGINSGSLMIPPAPLPPTSVPPPPHICIAGVDGLSAGILINDDDGLDDDDEIDLDNVQHEIFINDVRFDDEENHLEQMHHLENV